MNKHLSPQRTSHKLKANQRLNIRPGTFRPGAVLLVALAISSGDVKAATNALTNPGFETGNLAGWTAYGSAFVEFTNNTYYNGGNPGGSNVLTHSGTYVFKTFGQFSGGANFNGVFQAAAAAPGSLWSASGWALTHGQDHVSGGNTAWLEVSFRDSLNTILALFRSAVVDPNSPINSWLNLQVTNEIDIADSTTITNTVTNFAAPAGTASVRCQIVFAQPPGFDGGSVYFDDLDLEKIAGSDPDISSPPANQTKIVGQSATFTVVAAGSTTLNYRWRKGVDDLVNGGNVSGATSPTLTLSNLSTNDAGSYSVVVTNTAGSASASATLTVLTPEEAANYLSNPGLESGVFSPWISYGGAGVIAPIDPHGGLYVGNTLNGGGFNGFFQDVASDGFHTVAPGSVFTADGWALTSSADPISSANVAWIEVTFRNTGGNIIALYKSAQIDTTTPLDTWINLQVTNQIDLGDFTTVIGTTRYLAAPPGTSFVRCQTLFRGIAGGGSVRFDDLRLLAKLPVPLSTTIVGANLQISFPTQGATTYEARYKNDFNDATWQLLGIVDGDGSVKTVSDLINGSRRFYRVTTL